LARDFERGYHYSDSQGLPQLREKIADYYRKHYDASIDPTELLVTAGSKVGIYLSMLTALNPGDEVAIHEPCWLSYPHQARFCGAKPAFIPHYVEPADFAQWLSDQTKMLILNNPNNPSGRLYSRKELEHVYRVCSSRGIYLMVDEAYSDFLLDEPFPSAASIARGMEGVIVVNSLSKNMGMSGWRIGYVASSRSFIGELLKAQQHIITCAPTLLQSYCAEHFDRILACTLPQVRATVEKRERIAKFIDALGIQRLKGASTFYFFLGLGSWPSSSMEFALELLTQDSIAVVPGSAYGQSTDRFIRIGIGAEPEDRICAALERIKSRITTSPGSLSAAARTAAA
jgi:aspartate aminotransferase/aminotransferase